MSEYRICVVEPDQSQPVKFIKFDNKEDAEHYAKNQSTADNRHIYEVQKNNAGNFLKIKSYMNGQQI